MFIIQNKPYTCNNVFDIFMTIFIMKRASVIS